MTFLFYFFIFVIGLVIGSFLNVLIYRLPHSITLSGRSFCPKCKKKISWYDNIPLLTYFLLKGKCRKCSSPISLQYPIIELSTGILFVVSSFLTISHTPYAIDESMLLVCYSLLLISSLIVIFMIDLKHQIIPDSILIFLAIFSLPYAIRYTPYALLSSLLCGLFFLAIFLITKGKGMGFGDVKFAFIIGLILGFPKSILGLYLAFIIGALFGVVLILLKQKKFGQKIAFGPFLVLGLIIAFFYGDPIVNWLFLNFF